MANETAAQPLIPAVNEPLQPARCGPAHPQALIHYQQAYEQVMAASQGLDAKQLVQVNIDVPSAVTRANGILATVWAMRDQIKALPGFDISQVDQLQAYTFAMAHAHARFLAASAPPEALLELNAKGTALRDLLYLDSLVLSKRNLISGDRLADFKANSGYKNIAFDLLGLVALLRGSWDKISSKTGLQLSELDQAELLGMQLIDAVAAHEQAPSFVAAVRSQRARNFTLFTRAYDQVRRAVTYLHWDEGNVDDVIPSLYAGRGGRGKNSAAPTVNPTPSAPPALPPLPSTATGGLEASATSAHPSLAIDTGLPDSSSFITPLTS